MSQSEDKQPDLDLVGTAELIEALATRSTAVVVAVLDARLVQQWRVAGPSVLVQGLSSDLQLRIARHVAEHS